MDKKTGIVGLLLLTLLPLSVQKAQAQTAERGLKECIRMGIERNLSLKNARIGIEAGRTTVSQARANLLPQVNGTLQAGDYLKRPVNVVSVILFIPFSNLLSVAKSCRPFPDASAGRCDLCA